MEEHDAVSGGCSPIPRSDLKVTSLLLLLLWGSLNLCDIFFLSISRSNYTLLYFFNFWDFRSAAMNWMKDRS